MTDSSSENRRHPHSGHASEIRTGGFTLMELIIVISILAVMTATVMPLFRSSFAETTKDFAIRNLVSTLKYAQSIAISKSAEHRVYFSLSSNTYWIMIVTGRKGGEAVLQPVRDQYGDAVKLPPSLALEKIDAHKDKKRDAYYISFFPNGACDIATIQIELTKEERKRYTISTKGSLSLFKVKAP